MIKLTKKEEKKKNKRISLFINMFGKMYNNGIAKNVFVDLWKIWTS